MTCYALRCGLTVADFKNMSFGMVVEVIDTNRKIREGEDIHEQEKQFNQLKDVLEFIIEGYQNGEISEIKYQDFMKQYKEMEALYG